MASSLWKSFVEAVIPKHAKEPAHAEGVTHNHMVGGHPLSCHEPQSACTQETSSKASLECRGVTVDPNVSQPRESCDARVEKELNSDVEYQDSREYQNAPGSLAASIAVHQPAGEPPN